MQLTKTILDGEFARLEPLAPAHKNELCDAINDGKLWTLMVTIVPKINNIDEFFNNAENAFKQNDSLVFATIDKATGKVAGSSRFMRYEPENKKIEIGFTFLGKRHQKTRINTEAKLLMLTHAFEVLHLNRVEFLTDYLNTQSRNAILRIGAKQEGILRSHKVMPDGRVRDSVIFSILKHEWDGIKAYLQSKLL